MRTIPSPNIRRGQQPREQAVESRLLRASRRVGGLDPLFSGDGKIVVAGTETAGVFDNGDFLIRRYTANGSPDPTFSGNGSETIDFDAYADAAFDLAIADNGKIVAVGYASSDAGLSKPRQRSSASVRTARRISRSPGTASGCSAASVRRRPSCSRTTARSWSEGSRPDGSSIGFALARLDDAGKLDPSFSGDGLEVTSFGPLSSNVFDLVIDADGRIVAAGRYDTGSGLFDFAVARYDDKGVLDTGFSGDGKLTTDLGVAPGIDEAHGVALQPDGKIVVAGFAGGESIGS